MAKEFLGSGWQFPVAVDAEGSLALSRHEQDIRESIRIILSTAKGERLMRPDFGCGIHDYVFTTLNTSVLTLATDSVREALTLWEPRINLIAVQVNTDAIRNGTLLISIDYRVRTTNSQFNLVYPFYLTEGA